MHLTPWSTLYGRVHDQGECRSCQRTSWPCQRVLENSLRLHVPALGFEQKPRLSLTKKGAHLNAFPCRDRDSPGLFLVGPSVRKPSLTKLVVPARELLELLPIFRRSILEVEHFPRTNVSKPRVHGTESKLNRTAESREGSGERNRGVTDRHEAIRVNSTDASGLPNVTDGFELLFVAQDGERLLHAFKNCKI